MAVQKFKLHPFPIKTRGGMRLYDPCSNEIFRVDETLFEAAVASMECEQPGELWGNCEVSGASENELQEAREAGYLEAREISLDPRRVIARIKERESSRKATVFIIEVTEQCNLRCTYCCFSGQSAQRRGLGSRRAGVAYLKSAVEWYLRDSDSASDRHIAFYGGEPLLCWEEICETVDYARSVHRGAGRLYFAVATNGTLMTKELMSQFVARRIRFNVSLDGSKERHNWARVDSRGQGSFDKIMANLKYLHNNHGEKFVECVGISSTIDGNSFGSAMLDWVKLLEEYPFLKPLRRRIAFIEVRGRNGSAYLSPDIKGESDARKEYYREHVAKAESYMDKYSVPMSYYSRDLTKLHHRKRVRIPSTAFPSGMCWPGTQRIFLALGGHLYPCERVDDRSRIGTLERGIDSALAQEVFAQWVRVMESSCAGCWAIRLCTQCASHYTDADDPVSQMKPSCNAIRLKWAILLHLYCHIYDQAPHALSSFVRN